MATLGKTTITNLTVLNDVNAPKFVGDVEGGLTTTKNLYLKSTTTSGDTPAIVLQRGTLADSYYDNKIYNSGGALKIQYSSNGVDTDIASFAKSTTLLSSGLTLTGTADSTVASINFSRGGEAGTTTWNYITAPTGGNIVIAPHGIAKSSTTGYHFGATSLYPGVNNTYSLGADGLKWANVYATNFVGHHKGTILMTAGDANAYRNILVTNGSDGICYSAAGNVLLNYATGDVKATSFTGKLIGNASSATSATSATKIGEYTANDIFIRQSRPDNGFNIDEVELFGMRDIQPSSEITRTGIFPFDGWGTLMSFNGSNYFIQLATQSTSGGMYFRSAYGSGVKLSDKPWVKFLDSNNYSSYALPLSGGTLTGDLSFSTGNEDRFINFNYNGGTTYSWRLGYLGTGTGDANYLTIQSAKAAGTQWYPVVNFGNETLDANFAGNILPMTTNTKNLGSTSLKWANVYATTFIGNVTGNAASATKLTNTRTLWGQNFNGEANVSGDMTGVGSISMSKALTITGTDGDTANLHFGRASYNYISGPSGSTIHMCPGGISKSSITGYIFSSTSFYPGTTNGYSLGTSSRQWDNICGKTLYENGTSLENKYLKLSGGSMSGRINSQSIIPTTTNAYDLGSSSLKWANVYATTFNGNLTGNVTGNVTGSSGSCTGNAATATSATNASNIYINTSTSSSYYPMTFVTSVDKGNKGLYIDGGTAGTTSTAIGVRYNPSAKTCYCSGGFYEASDERLKNFSNDIEVDLDKLSKLSKKYFTWKDDESNAQHIGVSAQEVQVLYPELVEVIDEDGHLSVSYDKLSVIALKGIDVLNDKVKSLEERLERLEKLLNI